MNIKASGHLPFRISFLAAGFLLAMAASFAQSAALTVVDQDIRNFWNAFDRMKTTGDSARQAAILDELFLSRGSAGLRAIMQARRYTPEQYRQAVNRYPLFWNSIRANMQRTRNYSRGISKSIGKLQKLYHPRRPATVYLTIGVFRTNGTAIDSLLLIGSEMAMGDRHTVLSEFPENMQWMKDYYAADPVKDLAFLCTHEYVHTQQSTTIGNHLLTQCVLEGVAEFLAVLATGKPSITPAIAYGQAHEEAVRKRFIREIHSPFFGNWLWNNNNNEFGLRDMGYYVGYAICENYYAKAGDKRQAIKNMVELNYNDDRSLNGFVDASGYFPIPMEEVIREFESGRPQVVAVKGIVNNSKDVDPSLQQLTISFSERMDTRFRNFEMGPLGEPALLRLGKFLGWSEDGKAISFGISLRPGARYQLIVNSGFRTEDGRILKPYLLDFETKAAGQP